MMNVPPGIDANLISIIALHRMSYMKSCKVLMFLFVVLQITVAQAQIRPIPRPTPPIPFPTPEPSPNGICKRTCSDGMGQITYTIKLNEGSPEVCPARPQQVYSCAPFACDAKGVTCRVDCNDNRDCSSGFYCDQNSRKCLTVSYFCANGLGLNGTDKSYRACEPYICSMGSCLGMCQNENDCWPGYHCNSEYRCIHY